MLTISLHIVKSLQALLCNMDNLNKTLLFVCTQLKAFRACKVLNKIDR